MILGVKKEKLFPYKEELSFAIFPYRDWISHLSPLRGGWGTYTDGPVPFMSLLIVGPRSSFAALRGKR